MKKYIFIIAIVSFIYGCEKTFNYAILGINEEKIGLTNNSVIPPPATNSFVDSFRFALESIQMKFHLETEYKHIYIDNQTEQVAPVVVVTRPQYLLRQFYIKKEKIRVYDWNGYLLIALHEWYHIEYGCGDNEIDHERMLTDIFYHRWIQEIFGCSEYIVKYFVYIGFEDTEKYKALSDEEKATVERIKVDFKIKK